MDYDSTTDMWSGDIFLPQVSIDLFEVGQLFILEKMIKDYVAKTGITLSNRFETALEVESICEELLSHKGVYPNVDFYSGVLYSEVFKFTPEHFTPIFAMSRSAGWTAHWHEQVSNNRIFRPTQIYTGHDFRDYPTN